MDVSRTKRCLVSGGAGFIGSHLCRRLLQGGASVTCLDDFSTGSPQNIAGLLGRPDFTLIQHDVAQPLHVEADEIYHLACPASPIQYQRDPVRTTTTSVQGTLNMLELARLTGARLVHASTSEVYGDPDVHPQTEDYPGRVDPTGVRACYDEGKRCAETLCFSYQRQHGLRPGIARIFNTYGPNMLPDDGRVVSNFIVQALQGHDIMVFGDGRQTRSFCYVDDLVEGLVRLMAFDGELPGPVNLGSSEECTILALANRVLELVGSGSGIRYRPLPQDDPRRRRPSIERARALLDWEPRVNLTDGLKRTVAHFSDTERTRTATA